jgi:hypothetical protein
MRYISRNDIDLFRNDGTIAYQFKYNYLDLGSGNIIDASLMTPDSLSLQLVYPTDLSGATTERIEMAGRGTLYGEERLFVESPILDLSSGTIAAVDGTWYEVIAGIVSYNNKQYRAGDVFKGIDTNNITDVSSGAEIAKTYAGDNEDVIDRRGQFWLKHLQHGDEPYDYPVRDAIGYEPRSSLTTTDADYYGWTR